MQKYLALLMLTILNCSTVRSQESDSNLNYFAPIISEMQKKWPNNRMVNLVFHGHSVPSGYLTKGVVDRINSYPFKTLKTLNHVFPHSVINVITTSIGGEQAEQGAARMETTVLNHLPDILYIDYGLNDRSIGLEKSKKAWEKMIKLALSQNIKVVLITPTPDLREDILNDNSPLALHAQQIIDLAKKYQVEIVDAYQTFKNLAQEHNLSLYMAQNNHINEIGHQIVANLIIEKFTHL
jgi:hypothetical protein